MYEKAQQDAADAGSAKGGEAGESGGAGDDVIDAEYEVKDEN